ncbi:hypothetical protein QFZ67_000756 [Streptomyces sp. V1I1]|nr:hypothetical protein [Streptomyces sp. V1I1]
MPDGVVAAESTEFGGMRHQTVNAANAWARVRKSPELAGRDFDDCPRGGLRLWGKQPATFRDPCSPLVHMSDRDG